MKQFLKKAGRRGFTLIEVLVTVTVIGVLVAVTVPAVTSQIGAADPSRIASDLVNISAGIDAFASNMSPLVQPGDIEDLANAVTAADRDISDSSYTTSAQTRWKGPYIQRAMTANGVANVADTAFATGYASRIMTAFVRCNSKIASPCSQADTLDYLVVEVTQMKTDEFELVNKLIDAGEPAGSSSTASQSIGKFRYGAASSTAYYFATPLLK
jgi:prepilin-type N-terminal cleavage/methylation domain